MDEIKQTGFDHHQGTSGPFLSRLKDQVHGPVQSAVRPGPLQQEGCSKQRSCMKVMPAGMHDPGIHTFPGAFIFLIPGKGIDVRPEHDLGKVLSRSLRPPDLRYDAGPGLSFQRQDPKIRECLQKCADLSRRLKFFPRKLRMHMEVSLKLQDPVVFLVRKSVLMHFFLHEPPGTVLPVF